MAIEEIIGDYCSFLSNLCAAVKEIGIDITLLEIDHVCYRCSSTEEYHNIQEKLEIQGTALPILESIIGGRPITIYELKPPITFGGWRIKCLELASPKSGRTHRHGLEHAEVVIGTKSEEMIDSFPMLEKFAQQYPDIKFDFKAARKPINADICVAFEGGFSVKFHARPIYEVCAYEIAHGHVEFVGGDRCIES